MPGKRKYDWPSDEDLVKLVIESGGYAATGRALGIPPGSIQAQAANRGVQAKITAGLSKRKVSSRLSEIEQPPVDDPSRVKAVQDAATIKSLKRENADYAKALAGQEELFDRIVETTRVPVGVPKYETRKVSKKKPPRSAIAPIFDQQFGQFVRPSDTPGNQGSYSVEIFDQRLARWVDGVCGVIGKESEAYTVEELVIPYGGDHVEGDEIFAGQPWQLELDPCQQVWELALKMESAMKEVVRFAREECGIGHIALYGVDDNHGKVGGKRAGARPATYSWNWLFLKILFDRLRAEPINEFAIEPGGALFFRCAGHQFQLIHGHQIRGWAGLPFYGLTKFDGRSIRLHNTIYRYLLMGHHHQAGEVPNGAGETIISGDWVGPNNLSGIITAGSRPQQKVLFVSEKWGLAATERIYFADADEAYSSPHVYGREAA